MAFVVFGLTVFGALSGLWWRIEATVRTARQEAVDAARAAMERADSASRELYAHKIHVAETYISRVGLREQVDTIMDAVKDVGGQIRHISERIDRVIESGPAPIARRGKSAQT